MQFNNYFFTERELFTGKFQSEILPYEPSDSKVNKARPRLTFKVNNLFTIWPFAWLLQVCNRLVGIMGE